MPLNLLSKMLMDSYSEQEVEVAKQLFYELCIGGRPDAPRYKKRIGQEKKKHDIDDALNMVLGTPTDSMPTFVARNLDNLPAMSMDTFDLARIAKDLTLVKEELQKLSGVKDMCSELGQQVKALNNRQPGVATTTQPQARENSTKVDQWAGVDEDLQSCLSGTSEPW